MLVALTSDIHLGSSHPKHLARLLKAIALHKPDLYVNAGDDNGTFWGARVAGIVSRQERAILPAGTVIAKVPGNHDFWLSPAGPGKGHRRHDSAETPSLESWNEATEALYGTYAALGIHCFNRDGLLRLGGWTFVGHSMWYEEASPNTNDAKFLPVGVHGDTNRFLYRQGYNAIWNQLDALSGSPSGHVAVVTHFPLIGPRYDASGVLTGGADLTGEAGMSLGSVLRDDYGVKAFLCGHMHQQHLGPLRFEAGSNQNVGGASPAYDYPRYLLLDFQDDGTVTVVKSCSLKKGLRPDY